jgi:hypothetical protein
VKESSIVGLGTVLKHILPLTSRGILNAMEDPSTPEIPKVVVLRQERVNPTKIEIIGVEDHVVIATQVHFFRLLLFHKEGEEAENQTSSRGWIRQVTVSLRNLVRSSGANPRQHLARTTSPDYRIWTKSNKQQPHGCGRLHFLTNFDTHNDRCWDPDCDCFRRRHFTVDMFGDDPSAERERFSNSEDPSATACRLAISCLHECAKRIAYSFPGATPYPSEIFLMKRLPVGLCPYFPKEFDFNAPVVDRETFVEIVHLPYAAREQRRERRQVYSLNELS